MQITAHRTLADTAKDLQTCKTHGLTKRPGSLAHRSQVADRNGLSNTGPHYRG